MTENCKKERMKEGNKVLEGKNKEEQKKAKKKKRERTGRQLNR